jgi:hypothetical protein
VVRMMGGTLSLKNIIYEAMSSFHISGGDVIWNGGLDDGLNGEIGVNGDWRMNFFDINASAEGSLVIKDQDFSRGTGYSNEQPASFIWRDVDSANSARPMLFRVVLDGVTLRDWSWSATHVGYFPPVRGVAVELHDVEVSSWKMVPATPACKPPACEQTALERRFKVNPGVENLLALVADTTGATVVSKTSKDTTWDCFTQGGNPPSNDTHSGGWTVSAGASGGGFCSTTERLPNLVDGFAAKLTAGPAMAALRLAAGSRSTSTHPPSLISITSPLIQVSVG